MKQLKPKRKANNPWLIHLMKEKKKHPGKKLKEVMLIAKKSYKKIK